MRTLNLSHLAMVALKIFDILIQAAMCTLFIYLLTGTGM